MEPVIKKFQLFKFPSPFGVMEFEPEGRVFGRVGISVSVPFRGNEI